MTPTTTAVVLAAGSSRRLGRPKQTLAFRGTTLLGATVDVVRAADLDQRIVTLGGARDEIRDAVDLDGFDVVDVEDHGRGCSASIVRAVDRVDPEADGFVLLLGDQPGIRPEEITAVIAFARSRPHRPDAVLTRYDDGLGHPLWLSRRTFADLRLVRGDKAVWKLIDSGDLDVCELAHRGRSVPLDVDTQEEYEALLRADEHQPAT